MSEHPTDHAGLEILPFEACLQLLASVPVGRVEVERLSRRGLHPWVSAVEHPFWIRVRPTAVSGRQTPRET
jgi:hypothetical protein